MAEHRVIEATTAEPVSVQDRGVAYGDGVFETILVENRFVYAWPEHFARLSAGLQQIGLPLVDETDLLIRLNAAIRPLSPQNSVAVVKIIITAGCSQRGYLRDPDSPPTIRVWANSLPRLKRSAVSLGTALRPISSMPYLAGLKTLNRLDQVLAANNPQRDVDEQLLTDTAGRVVCATSSNFFWREGRQWFTPPITSAGIEGTRRALWITRLNARRQPASVGRLALADQAFLCNAVNVYRPVARLLNRALIHWPVPDEHALVEVQGGYQFRKTAATLEQYLSKAGENRGQDCWSSIRGINK